MHYIEFTDNTRTSAWNVSEWFMKEYLSDKSIFLTIDERDLSGEGVEGWCIKETDNEFLIQIDKNLQYDYVPTMLHELYHVYQWVNNKPQDEYECMSMELPLYEEYMGRDRQTT